MCKATIVRFACGCTERQLLALCPWATVKNISCPDFQQTTLLNVHLNANCSKCGDNDLEPQCHSVDVDMRADPDYVRMVFLDVTAKVSFPGCGVQPLEVASALIPAEKISSPAEDEFNIIPLFKCPKCGATYNVAPKSPKGSPKGSPTESPRPGRFSPTPSESEVVRKILGFRR